MLPEKKTRTNIGVGIGFLLQLAGFALSGVGEIGAIIGLLLILVSIPVFIWGCMNYAEGKGHSKWVGLVGVAGIIGLIVLIVFPDQHKAAPLKEEAVNCVQCQMPMPAGQTACPKCGWSYKT